MISFNAAVEMKNASESVCFGLQQRTSISTLARLVWKLLAIILLLIYLLYMDEFKGWFWTS